MSDDKCSPSGSTSANDDGGDDYGGDVQAKYRDSCRATTKCLKFFEKLTTCNDRVNSRSKTAETCLEEAIDYVNCVDHCAAKRFFPKLK